MSFSTLLDYGVKLIGRSNKIYTLIEPLCKHVIPHRRAHIWKATSSTSGQVVLKFPRRDTEFSNTEFQKEVNFLGVVKDSRRLRGLLDTIPACNAGDEDGAMVLEFLPRTLWQARDDGSLAEIGIPGVRRVMRDVLEGVREMHDSGWLHLDIKAQNILLDGKAVKLADFGSIWAATPPSTGMVQPMPYRSPEVMFDLQWSKAADVWGWGMVYQHMIQAVLRPDIWGLYDRQSDETASEDLESYEKRIRSGIFHDFDLGSVPYFQDSKELWPEHDSERENVTFRSTLEYLGFPDTEIQLIERVLVPDPRLRPTAKTILDERWLDDT